MLKIKRLLILSLALLLGGVLFIFPAIIKSQTANTLLNLKTTMSNSRLSYKASVDGTPTAGASIITIDTESADDDTNHLFPGDTICFVNAAESGCIGNRTYGVNGIINTTSFVLDDVLAAGTTLAETDFVVATASGNFVTAFTTVGDIPATTGRIKVIIPSVNTAAKTNDGIPDTNTTIASNGFDIKGGNTVLGAGDIEVTGCTGGTEVVTAGGASADTYIEIPITAACTGGASVVITTTNNRLINPAPFGTTRTRGNADEYSIVVETYADAAMTQKIDEGNAMVAPVEAVFVSAVVDETLTFLVEGVASAGTNCGSGNAADVTTYAYSVPWGNIAAFDAFQDAQQKLTVSTNADDGYAVTIEENDQMGLNGQVCTGPGAGESVGCIKDTTCDGAACDEDTEDDWETVAINGFGISLAGADAAFKYNVASGSCIGTAETDFCARQIADQQTSAPTEPPVSIMSNGGPVADSIVYVCYRIDINQTQPAGYYYNKVKYVATPTF